MMELYTPIDFEAAEENFRIYLREAVAEGWTIVQGTTRDLNAKTCCALGAVDRHEMDASLYLNAQKVGLSSLLVQDFIDGFDGRDGMRTIPGLNEMRMQAYQMGRRLAKEFIHA